MKQWLLEGAEIANSAAGEDNYFNICPFSLRLKPEDELDAMAAALA